MKSLLPCHLKSGKLPNFSPAAGSVNQILLQNRVQAIRNQAKCQNFSPAASLLEASTILNLFANTKTEKIKKNVLGFKTQIFFLGPKIKFQFRGG